MASAVTRAYNSGLGADPPAESKGRAPSQEVRGVKPHKAETFLAFKRSIKAANLPTFLQFRNSKKSNISVIFAKKITGGHEIGGLGQNCCLCPPGPSLKPPLALFSTRD